MKPEKGKITIISLLILIGTLPVLSLFNKPQNDIQISTYGNISSPSSSYLISWPIDGVNVTNITDNVGIQQEQQVASDDLGNIFVTWADSRNASLDIHVQRFSPSGVPYWGENGSHACFSAGAQTRPQILPDGLGGVYVCWMFGIAGVFANRILPNGTPLLTDKGVKVGDVGEYIGSPDIVSDGSGGAIIVWGNDTQVRAQRMNSSGDLLWQSNGSIIATSAYNVTNINITTDGAGGAIVKYLEDINQADIYVQRVNSTGNGTWGATGVQVETDITNTAFESEIVNDNAGGAIVAWRDNRGLNGDIYIQRINSSGNRLLSDTAVPITEGPFVDRDVHLVSDGNNGAILTWHENFGGGTNDIRAQKVDGSGNRLWGQNGTLICGGEFAVFQNSPRITTDGLGGAIITWLDGRNASTDIYAQIIDSSGSIKWQSNGTVISNATTNENTVQIGSDGFGGAVIVWRNFINGTLSFLNARRIVNEAPTVSSPANQEVSQNSQASITWIIQDDGNAGKYNVEVIDANNSKTTVRSNASWTTGGNLVVPIDTTVLGTFNYTIDFWDTPGVFGTPDTVVVTIVEAPPASVPGYANLLLGIAIIVSSFVLVSKIKNKLRIH
ncbi:MAG: hypothetical protein ACFFCS_23405 [Candidatus Hodarchaeota archaeon]